MDVKRMLVACLLVIQVQSPAQGVREPRRDAKIVLTLDSALALALGQNRDIMIADKDRYRADAQISEAWAGAMPQISLTGLYTRNIMLPVLFLPPNTAFNPGNSTETLELGSNNSYLLGATFSQVLFSRKVGTALDIAHTYHDYSEEGYRAATQNVYLAVKKAFYGVLLARELAGANREGLDVVRSNVENVRLQYKNGNAAEYDLLRAEVELANTEPLQISADNALLLSLNALKNVLAIPLDTEIDVAGGFAFEDVPEGMFRDAAREALSSNPAIVQLALQEDMLEKNISIERANYFPTLSLIGSYQYQTQDNTFAFRNYFWATSLNIGLQVSFPLFDGFRTGARTEQAMIDRDKVHYARLKAEEGIRIQLQAAELGMGEAKKRIAGQERNIAQAEKAVRISQTRYRSGVGTQLELMDSQVAMTRARAAYARAMYDFLVAKAEWENISGRPGTH